MNQGRVTDPASDRRLKRNANLPPKEKIYDKFTTAAAYHPVLTEGTLALLCALANVREPFKTAEIASHAGTSTRRFEHDLRRLSHAGVLHSRRGPNGGYTLTSGLNTPISLILRTIEPRATPEVLSPSAKALLGTINQAFAWIELRHLRETHDL